MPEVDKSGELEFKPYADGYFGEVAGITIGITGGYKASVGSKDIFRIGYAASEQGHAQRKIYGRAPSPVEPVADSRGEIYATVVGCVGPQAQRQEWGKSAPFGVGASLGEDGNQHACVSSVIVMIVMPVEIVLQAHTSSYIKPSVELIAVGSGEAEKHLRVARIAGDKTYVGHYCHVGVEKAAITLLRLECRGVDRGEYCGE